MFNVILIPTESPISYIDKTQAIYRSKPAPANTICHCCGIDLEESKVFFADTNERYYCEKEIKVVDWYEFWEAYERPPLDCVTKKLWFQLTDGGDTDHIRLMITNDDSKNTRTLDFYYGNWIKFMKGAMLFEDLRTLKSGRSTQRNMIVVAPMDNDNYLVKW